jgi:4-hydroxy-3-methylbut-2-enyl diphosphate reductase IspH
MLTVSISVNGEVIYARTVVNRLKEKGVYICDDGSEIIHKTEDGAVKLAIKALETIKEV